MPIYEYRCQECGAMTSAIILKPEKEKEVSCGKCGGKDLSRLVSRFALHKTEAQRVADFDTKAAQDDSFYKDDRNVGLWAKKRVKELGADLGSDFDETIDRARSGKILDDA